MTVEEFREQAIQNGTFEKLKTQNVVLTLKDNIKTTGFLNFLRNSVSQKSAASNLK